MNEEQKNRYCPQCGAACGFGAAYCSNCGRKLEEPFGTAGGEGGGAGQDWYDAGRKTGGDFADGLSKLLYFFDQQDYIPFESEENVLIGPNGSYYRGKFDEMRCLRQKQSWNWSALIFGFFWMLYRKMYGLAGGMLVISALLGLLGAPGTLLQLGLMVCCGLFGNYLYMMTVQKRVGDLQQFAEPARSQYLQRYAGTSTGAVLIGLVIFGLCSIPYWLLMGLSFLSFLRLF